MSGGAEAAHDFFGTFAFVPALSDLDKFEGASETCLFPTSPAGYACGMRSDADDYRSSPPPKAPHEWVSGDDPVTGALTAYLTTLCEEAKSIRRCPTIPPRRLTADAGKLQTATSRL